MNPYEATADLLVRRIEALIPEHPEVLTLTDAWGLFKVPGFTCDDIGPSFAQAQWALTTAQRRARQALPDSIQNTLNMRLSTGELQH